MASYPDDNRNIEARDRDRGNIAVAVTSIQSSLNSLRELISDLEDQLQPIRRPIPTSDEKEGDSAPRAESSELAEELRSISRGIDTLCRRVTELQREVDL